MDFSPSWGQGNLNSPPPIIFLCKAAEFKLERKGGKGNVEDESTVVLLSKAHLL